MKHLRRLWRRIADCRYGRHRETAECAFGILELRCVDCGARTRVLGWVYVGVSNRKPHPWERGA